VAGEGRGAGGPEPAHPRQHRRRPVFPRQLHPRTLGGAPDPHRADRRAYLLSIGAEQPRPPKHRWQVSDCFRHPLPVWWTCDAPGLQQVEIGAGPKTPWAAIAGVIATVSVFAIAQGLSYPLSFILERQVTGPGRPVCGHDSLGDHRLCASHSFTRAALRRRRNSADLRGSCGPSARPDRLDTGRLRLVRAALSARRCHQSPLRPERSLDHRPASTRAARQGDGHLYGDHLGRVRRRPAHPDPRRLARLAAISRGHRGIPGLRPVPGLRPAAPAETGRRQKRGVGAELSALRASCCSPSSSRRRSSRRYFRFCQSTGLVTASARPACRRS
jgi:hypothetical protein